MDKDARYRELLAKQLRMNEATWAALQRRGVTEASALRLEFAYRAPAERNAIALRTLLAAQTDYEVTVQSDGTLLRKRWSISGTTQPTAISPAILDQWVDWMVTAGLEHECEFDGWGTQI